MKIISPRETGEPCNGRSAVGWGAGLLNEEARGSFSSREGLAKPLDGVVAKAVVKTGMACAYCLQSGKPG